MRVHKHDWQGEFHALLKSAPVPQIRIHDLRHSCATILLAAAHHVVLRQRTALEPRLERLSLDEFHDQQLAIAGRHRADVRVVSRAR